MCAPVKVSAEVFIERDQAGPQRPAATLRRSRVPPIKRAIPFRSCDLNRLRRKQYQRIREKMKRRSLLALAAVVLTFALAGCAGRPLTGIPGESLTDATLSRDTYRNIGIIEKAQNGNFNPRILNTKIVEPPATPGGPWKEQWTVSHHGTPVEYNLTFTPSPRGGTAIAIKAPPKQ
jgi:hypothetical protein